MKNIKEEALKLSAKYQQLYQEWCKENPGCIMNGTSIKEETLRKASFALSKADLQAMERCYEIERFSMGNRPNGFKFSIEAIQELIDIL